MQRPALEDPEQHFTTRTWVRAQRYLADGQITAAKAALEALLLREPTRFAARMLLASVYLKERQVKEAAEQAKLASQSLPDDADAVAAASQCLVRAGEFATARENLMRYDAFSRDLDGPHLRLMARTYQKLGDNTSALKMLDQACLADPGNADVRYFHGLQLQFHGQMDAAKQEMEECLRIIPTYGRAALTLARLSKGNPDPARLAFIRGHLADVPRQTEEHAAFEFAQFEELENLRDFDGAFAALERGNAIMHKRLAADEGLGADVFNGVTRIATPTFVSGPGLRLATGPVPIFIVGLPRSGTTLLDRMLGNHPDVKSAGELTDFPLQLRWCANLHGNQTIDAELLERIPDLDFAQLGRRYLEQTQWRAGGSAFYVDKLPPNHLLTGFIRRALPFAPILHMAREPMGVCFSNYKALFGNSYAYSYQLQELSDYYARYGQLMDHWRSVIPDGLMDVDYRALVTDTDATLAKVFAHCRLRHADGCGNVTENASPVATLSCAEVREPVHTRGLGDWMRYQAHLEPLRLSLTRAGVHLGGSPD
ncbi:MAG: tetratricopeptide repeat-containing sulfotransferase family protein [Rhodanobacteraceae bacterium]